jgi:tetratricopeptide (TPR) repeat protein
VEWVLLLSVLAIMLIAYEPSWFGTPIWDDDHHLTPPGLRSLEGLGRIWTDVSATTQYYPLLHSTFWILHRLWGDAVLGYHLFTLALHGVCVVLVFIALRRLRVPGALLAAALFALHPIQVESVAWMTELKNTLSTCLYLMAALIYLRFDDTRRPGLYAAGLVVFMLALLTKTVTGMLPFTLAVVLWWKRGVLHIRRDLVPLLPYVVLGVSMGLLTAWWEIEFNNTGSAAFAMTWTERVLVGGRAAWFQLGSLLWPADLLFSYPRWEIDAADWRQYLYPVGVGAAVMCAWLMRARSRAPLAALLFFLITLAPTLGAFTLYTFRYSYVADHYQYVACLGIFALAAGVVWPWLTTPVATPRLVTRILVVGVLAACTTLTWQQSHAYGSAEASYRAILRGHPDSWFAHANLGAVLITSAPEEALTHLQEAVRLNPDLAEAHGNLGLLHLEQGRPREAVDACIRALAITPRLRGATRTLADAYSQLGRPDLAVEYYERALGFSPGDPQVLAGLGQALVAVGRATEGLRHLRTAVDQRPASAPIRSALGLTLAQMGDTTAATEELQRAVTLDPRSALAHYGLGNILLTQGRLEQAVAAYQASLAVDPEGLGALNNLGVALDRLDRLTEAEHAFRSVLRRQPGYVDAVFNLAGLLERTGRLADAAGLYTDLLSHDADDLGVRLHLARVLVRIGKTREATDHVRAVLARKPGHPIDDPALRALIR